MVSLEQQFCDAFNIELENLYFEYIEFNQNSIDDKDFMKLQRIGEWQRLVTLDRLQGNRDGIDDESFTELESQLLFESGKLILNGKFDFSLSNTTTLDQDRLNQINEWDKATNLERVIGFGYHTYLHIISGAACDKLAIVLYRIACENLIYIDQNNENSKDVIEQNARIALARMGANALHKQTYALREETIAKKLLSIGRKILIQIYQMTKQPKY